MSVKIGREQAGQAEQHRRREKRAGAVGQHVDAAERLADGGGEQRQHERRDEGEREQLGQPGRGADPEQTVARDRQRQREERAAAGGLRQQATGAEQGREQRQHLRHVLAQPLRPDIAPVGSRQRRDLQEAAAHFAGVDDGGHQRQQLDDSRIGEHGADGGEDQDRQADREAPPRLEPRLVPEHVSSPRPRFRERFPSASPARRPRRPD